MKVLTLHQPWASLIALGVKTIETRPNRTHIRGRIAIHAATKPSKGQLDDVCWHVGRDGGWIRRITLRNQAGYVVGPMHTAPAGAIVATAELIDCLPMLDGAGCGPAALRIFHGPAQLLGDDPAGDPRLHRNFTDELPYGDYRAGRWAWILDDVQPLAEPVPFKGGQGWSRSWDGA